jgi:hypothetical protein
VRQLYADDDEVLFHAARPLLLNGIEDVVSRPDLADRGIFLTVSPIGEHDRRSEAELWREFEIARPLILGAIFDAAVQGLQTLPSVRLTSLPRMADFALWAAACETALWPIGTFARAYAANRKAAVERIIEADPIAVSICRLMAEHCSWVGTASDLLRATAGLADDNISKTSAGWPKNPGALAGRLRRAQTFLRMLGIEIAFSREGRAGTRTIRISSSVENRPRPSAPSAPSARFATTISAAMHNSEGHLPSA